MEKPYCLEIYGPGSAHDLVAYFESDRPFMPIHPGDLINPSVWPGMGPAGGEGALPEVLRAVSVEHRVWQIRDQVKHGVLIFTVRAHDTQEARTALDPEIS